MADTDDSSGVIKILETNVTAFKGLLESEGRHAESCVIFRSESNSTEKLIINRRSKRLIPIMSWARNKNLSIKVPVERSAAKKWRLIVQARLIIHDFIVKCMNVYKKGKVIEGLHPQFIWVKGIEEHDDDSDNQDRDDGVDLNGGVVICNPVLLDLTNENFTTYLNEIYRILKGFGDLCPTVPPDFSHLLDSFADITMAGRGHFHPSLLSCHPSILVGSTLSNLANEVFMKVRDDKQYIRKLDRLLHNVFLAQPSYRPPLDIKVHAEWPELQRTRRIDDITLRLGTAKGTTTSPVLLKTHLLYLLFIRDCITHHGKDTDVAEQEFFAIYPHYLPVLFHVIIKEGSMEDLFGSCDFE